MTEAPKILNISRDLTMPISMVVCHPWARLDTINKPTKFEVCIFTHYKYIKGDNKCEKLGGSW